MDLAKQELFNRIECMLFTAGDPVPTAELARVLRMSKPETETLLKEMESFRNENRCGTVLLVTEETVQLISNRSYLNDIELLLNPDKKKTVSQSIMETLAIVAYKQPVTRAEIENIRGVRCDYAVTQLIKMGLIADSGHKDVPGHPVLFSTTDRFLRYFGLHSLEELPSYEQFTMPENEPEIEI